ncbi:hypothetical protein [Aeromonas media]|uniref:hypothetical protein n=1 Tax=Aeromonas media TaxID=651 RepID=UPI00384B4B17
MGRTTLTIWILLLGWLWMQPALAQHPLEADLPEHNHACTLCALHLDGKLALTPTPLVPTQPSVIELFIGTTLPTVTTTTSGHSRIRAPPYLHCSFR